MDFLTLKKCARLLSKDVSVILRGRHGIGKTEVIRQLAEEFELPVIDRRLAQLSEGDLIGLPHNENNRATKFLPPSWFVEAMDKPHMIFLDEFDRATREVQQAGMELILERSVQGNKLHPDCRVYAAINGGKHGSMYQVINIDPAIYDRFWIADCEPSPKEWIAWAKENGVIKEITDFISLNKDALEQDLKKETYKVSPSRRSWTRLSGILKENPDIITNLAKNSKIFLALCSGLIGSEATARFKSFLLNPEYHISVETILDRFDENQNKLKNLKIEHLNLAIEKISEHTKDPNKSLWTSKQVKNVDKFFRMLTPELRMSMWYKLGEPGSKIENMQALSMFVSDLIIEIVG